MPIEMAFHYVYIMFIIVDLSMYFVTTLPFLFLEDFQIVDDASNSAEALVQFQNKMIGFKI